MQITSEAVEPCQMRLTIVVPESRVDRAVHATAQTLGRRLKIRGYRPGKIPVGVVATQVGEETLREEAMESLAREVVEAAIEAEALEAAAPATVAISSADPVTFDVLVPLVPVVSLGDYRTALRVAEQAPEPVTEAMVDDILERRRAELAYLEPMDRPSGPGDVVTVSVVGRTLDDKVIFEDDSLTARLDEAGIAAAHLPEAALEPLLGHAAGELFEFTLSYPEDWRQVELQGRAVTFGTKMLAVAELQLPELDDDFASQVSDVDTLAELRSRLRERLELGAVAEARQSHAEAVLDRLVEIADVSYPPALLEAEQARILADVRERVERQGMRWERWLELQNQTEDALWTETEAEARSRLERRLVLGAFVRAEGIEVPSTEVDTALRRGRASLTPAQRRRLPKERTLRRQAENELLADLALQRLLAIAAGEANWEAPSGDAATQVAPAEEGPHPAAPAADDEALENTPEAAVEAVEIEEAPN